MDIDPNSDYDPSIQGDFDFDEMVVMLDNGERIPITNLMGAGGVDVTDPTKAYALVAGPTKDDMWLTFEITQEDLREAGLIH